MYLFFDTETTGLPKDYKAPLTDSDNWPRIMQIAMIHIDSIGCENKFKFLIRPPYGGFDIGENLPHGITNEICQAEGHDLCHVLDTFAMLAKQSKYLIAHNYSFDRCIVGAEFHRIGMNVTHAYQSICTMNASTKYCAIPNTNRGGFKWPKLQELHMKLFGKEFNNAHDAGADIEATKNCFFELRRLGLIELPAVTEIKTIP